MTNISPLAKKLFAEYNMEIRPSHDNRRCYVFDSKGDMWEASIESVNNSTQEELFAQVLKIVFGDTVL